MARGASNPDSRDKARVIPPVTFYTADKSTSTIEFPDHYTLYVLYAKDRSGGIWDKGDVRGIALSPTASEVVYWAESW